ncbi:MAG: peptide chain release factor N(5)-glutamine methyltransferase [Sporolactobacillus sp.]
MRRFDFLKRAAAALRAHGRDENIGEILLQARLGISRTAMLADSGAPLPEEDVRWLEAHVHAHIFEGIPVQYMLKEAPFFGRSFTVNADVLIPRQETEELVYRVGVWTARYFPVEAALNVCDIGTGSGAIAVTLALEHPAWHVTATDVSGEALNVARMNARRLGAALTFEQGSFTVPLVSRSFDVLVSNPPYISAQAMAELPDTVKNFEPHLALHGGADGLDAYRQIIAGIAGMMGQRAYFIAAFEIGADQGTAVAELLRHRFASAIVELAVEKDIAGLERNVIAVLRTGH